MLPIMEGSESLFCWNKHELVKKFSCFRSDNVYFSNNKQASFAVFTAGLCFAHAENSLVKLKLYNNWLAQVVRNSVMWNSNKPIKLKFSKSINVK